MQIKLKDGSIREYNETKTVYEVAKDISDGLARVACAGELDGKIVDLRTEISNDCELNIVTVNEKEGLKVVRHTASHIMAEAVKRLFPDAKVAIGPAIEDGFYYDFDHTPFSREDLDRIEAEMKKIIREGHEITRFTMPREEAIQYMRDRQEPYKVELIEDLEEGAEISFYDQGGFVDLCAGPHLMSTKGIKAYKLISSSMAYWRGDEHKAQLQRIYATAFHKKEDLAAYLESGRKAQEEAKRKASIEEDPDESLEKFFVSSLPWLSYTALIQPVPSPADSNPRITFGKYFTQEGRTLMPVSLLCNHALVDGRHIAAFYHGMEQELAAVAAGSEEKHE